MKETISSELPRKKALVAGALGVSGRAIVRHLASFGGWEVVGLSRRRADFEPRASFVSADLLDRDSLRSVAGALEGVTHVVYTALQMTPDPFEEVSLNLAMLRNVVEAVEAASGGLRKVILMEGAKFYGAHLGPYKTPAREDDPRHFPPNFYYDQEDHLRARSEGKAWSWTAFRPSCICGFAVGNPMNMATVIAVYGSLCRELGLPFRFPGTSRAYSTILEMTDADLLARACDWAAGADRCDGQAFNITNGDFWRWESLWPKLADSFGLPVAPPLRLPLARFMADKGPVWDAMVEKYGLLRIPFRDAAGWEFAEAIFNIEYDVMSDTTKSRRFGFLDFADTGEMLARQIEEFRALGFIPPRPS